MSAVCKKSTTASSPIQHVLVLVEPDRVVGRPAPHRFVGAPTEEPGEGQVEEHREHGQRGQEEDERQPDFLGVVLACGVAARLGGETRKDAFAIGALMNARGLMELILLNIGYERGMITQTLFTILVIMAVVTTIMSCSRA